MEGDAAPVRIGVLGAARITPAALIRPAADVDGVSVEAIAARDPARARTFARKHTIGRVLDSYDELVADSGIDAVYVPLPNGLHGRWSIAAIEAGKHVLCEKPFTANADEARAVALFAAQTDRVVMEAFHYRYHPVARRMADVVASGELGTLRRVETSMCVPLPLPGDIRYRLDLAGGATMDVGAYALDMARLLCGGAAPTLEVVSAEAALASPGVDRAMSAVLRTATGIDVRATCSLWSMRLLAITAHVVGDSGELKVLNPVSPQHLHRIRVRTPEGSRTEVLDRTPTYTWQLRAFVSAITEGAPVPTGPEQAVANMELIDAVYRAAGLEPRQPTTGGTDPPTRRSSR